MAIASELGPLPERGAVSEEPAARWDWAMVTGNGIHGALTWGEPGSETLAVNHCRLFLPIGSWEHVPHLGPLLPEVRRIIREQDHDAASLFMQEQASLQGYSGLRWTDPYHLGFEWTVHQEHCDRKTAYVRTEDFETGEVTTRWIDAAGLWRRRLFVSRPDDCIVFSLTGPKPGVLTCDLSMTPLTHPLIEPIQITEQGGASAHVIYVNGKGGYDAAVRVVVKGGTVTSDGASISIKNADEALILARIRPFRRLEDGSLERLRVELAALPPDYDELFKPHAKAHGALFHRITVDFGGASDRMRPTDDLLAQAKSERRIPPALLEKIYDSGRYLFLCASGERPPNLQGIWNGAWGGEWSSDYTTDTNLELAIGSASSANLRECLQGYFDLVEESLPVGRRVASGLAHERRESLRLPRRLRAAASVEQRLDAALGALAGTVLDVRRGMDGASFLP